MWSYFQKTCTAGMDIFLQVAGYVRKIMTQLWIVGAQDVVSSMETKTNAKKVSFELSLLNDIEIWSLIDVNEIWIIFSYLLIFLEQYEKIENMDCIDNTYWFHSLPDAKMFCSSARDCLGIRYHDLKFYICIALVTHIGRQSDHIYSTVYRKTELTGTKINNIFRTFG